MTETKVPPATRAASKAHDLQAAFEATRAKFAAEDINPYDLNDPLAQQKYLIARGWRPLGDPRHEYTRWQSPRAVFQETKATVLKTAPHFKGWDENEKPAKPLYKDEPVMVKNKFGQAEQVKQTVVTYPTAPYLLCQAMEIQVGWEREAQEKVA